MQTLPAPQNEPPPPSTIALNIGSTIRSYRLQRGMSQGDIEKRTGLLRCYLSRVENGHTVPSLETLQKIAHALELQLAQQDISVLQEQYTEGKVNLRDLERARLNENEKWMAFLDANFQRQQAQLDLLRTAGELDKVWQ